MLFLLHFGFHALMLGGTCCLLAEFDQQHFDFTRQ